MTLVCPPDILTRGLGLGASDAKKWISAELLTVSRCSRDCGPAVLWSCSGTQSPGQVCKGPGLQWDLDYSSRHVASQSPSLVLLEILWKLISHHQGVAVRIKCENTWGMVWAYWSKFTPLFHKQVLDIEFQVQGLASQPRGLERGGDLQVEALPSLSEKPALTPVDMLTWPGCRGWEKGTSSSLDHCPLKVHALWEHFLWFLNKVANGILDTQVLFRGLLFLAPPTKCSMLIVLSQ